MAINLLSKATFSLPILCRLSMTILSLFSYWLKLIIVKIASFDSAHILSTWSFTMLKGKKLYLEHEITCIKIYLQFTKNKRRKQEFICFKNILPLKFIYNDNKSCKKLRVCSFRWIQKRILDLKTDFAFLSANPNPDFWQKGFTGFEIRRIQIQINGLVIYAVPFTVDPKLVRWSSGIFSWSIPTEAVEFPRCFHLPQNIWKH